MPQKGKLTSYALAVLAMTACVLVIQMFSTGKIHRGQQSIRGPIIMSEEDCSSHLPPIEQLEFSSYDVGHFPTTFSLLFPPKASAGIPYSDGMVDEVSSLRSKR